METEKTFTTRTRPHVQMHHIDKVDEWFMGFEKQQQSFLDNETCYVWIDKHLAPVICSLTVKEASIVRQAIQIFIKKEILGVDRK